MVKIFVDSGSSITQAEKDALGVEILPLRITLDGVTYTDGIDLSLDVFYDALIEKKQFPQTSLPSLEDAERRVCAYTDRGDDVLIITISSGISGTYGTLCSFFASNEHVRVLDSKSAVGGVRLLVMEANRHEDMTLDDLYGHLLALVPRLRVIAVPETLEYLCRGGRLSRGAATIGGILQLKPLISLDSTSGSVRVLSKERGIKRAMQAVVKALIEENADTDFGIVPSYTYEAKNLDRLLEMTDERYKSAMLPYDHLDPAIACHWGPGAFGYIFITKA